MGILKETIMSGLFSLSGPYITLNLWVLGGWCSIRRDVIQKEPGMIAGEWASRTPRRLKVGNS